MSLFSRFFRKTPPPSPAPVSSAQSAASKKADGARSKPNAADRALITATEEKALQSAIDSQDSPAIARLVLAGTSTRIRQAAAEAIEDPELLRQLIREVRGGNDKSVYKILTSKRDAGVEQARAREQLQIRLDAAAKDLELHSRRPYDALYGPQLDQFEGRWNNVSEQADPAMRDRVQQWIDRSRQTLAEHARQVEAQAAAQAARVQAAADAAAEAERLREPSAQIAAEPAVELAVGESPPAEAPAPSEEQRAAQQAARELGDLIRKARGALSGGNTARAAGVRRTLEEKLAGTAALPAHLAGQLQQLDKKLDELKDWKRFSVAPKRAELVEEMEALIGAELDPQSLADRIKDLRDEWRTLGKGAGGNADSALDAEAQRFHEAAKKAYEPCVEYFAAQALVRQENQRRRDEVLARLTAFQAMTHAGQPDWRAVIKELREIKQEWRGHSPVDPQAGRAQQERFSALVTGLQERLDAEYERNLKQKESLIERARQLLASEDGRKAIEAAKHLQQQWKSVGPVPREADQRLWEEFRQHSDAVFQKRQQESAAYTAGLEANKSQAVALCEQIEALAALEGADLLAGAGKRNELRDSFEALGEFPRADTRDLRHRLDRALERCDKALARQRARDAEQSWTDLFEAAGHVRRYRLAVACDAEAQQVDALRVAADAYIASVSRWPKRGLETVKQALGNARAEDLSANEAALRTLCIRAEILTDLATPAEDQPLRREYQLQRLVQNMGQGARAEEAHLDTLAIEWISVGPVDDATYEPLLRRFRGCRERSQEPS